MSGRAIAALAESAATSGYAALVLDRLVKQTCQVVNSTTSSIFARDPHYPGTAIAVAACGAHEDLIGSRVPVAAGFHPNGNGKGGATLPAYWDGEQRGALTVEASDGRRFGASEIALLGELASTAGAALGHAERRGRALRAVRTRVSELIDSIDAHDGYTGGHSEAVVRWSCLLGERLQLGPPDMLELELGALLHDLGKVRVPNAILRKPAPLDSDEHALVKRHPAWGGEILESVPGLEPVATIVRFHHERWDGAGYPDGLARDRIPMASRIIAVCDSYQAMTSDRPYRRAMPPAAAASELCARAGTQFDPAVVDCFVDVLHETGWPLQPVEEGELVRMGGAR